MAPAPVYTLPNQHANVGHLAIRQFNCGDSVTFKPHARFLSRYQKIRGHMEKTAKVVSYFDDDELDIEFEGGPTVTCSQDDLNRA